MDTLPSQKIKWLKKNQKSKSKGRHITWLSWALSSSSAWVSVLPYVKEKNGEGGYFKKLPSHLVSLFLQRKGQWEKLNLVWNPQRRLWAHVWSSRPISGPLRHGGALSGWPSAGWVAHHVHHALLPAGHSQNPRSLPTWQRSPAVSDRFPPTLRTAGRSGSAERQARPLEWGLPGWRGGEPRPGDPVGGGGGGAGASFQGQLYPVKSSSLEAAAVTLPAGLPSCLLFSLSWSSKFFTLSSSSTLSDSRDWTTECRDLADAFSPLSTVTWNTWAGLGSARAQAGRGKAPWGGYPTSFLSFSSSASFSVSNALVMLMDFCKEAFSSSASFVNLDSLKDPSSKKIPEINREGGQSTRVGEKHSINFSLM